ncbi:DUF805 domain-containing protein [Polaribacter sargassicola]|uniref:DUF805 domain-containing protein n=1 Tax=Polaribacter sargassicola TaxID=2836891 RepID=UPI001F33FBE8|nr:DUF805 domain-containing protein [Polaribacter sp. DS7-9]MCG1036795.1 DUF805 domain-containing protein [Polaribacter sp. DS7-9]
MNWYLKVLKDNYSNFNGRARRKEFWMFILFQYIATIVFVIIFAFIGDLLNSPAIMFISYVYILATIIPSLAVTVRRLHDVGKSGWYYFVSIIPVIGGIWLFVLLCLDSENGSNKWGENPKGFGNNSLIDQIGVE